MRPRAAQFRWTAPASWTDDQRRAVNEVLRRHGVMELYGVPPRVRAMVPDVQSERRLADIISRSLTSEMRTRGMRIGA